MSTKEECLEALEHIKTLRGSNYGWYYSGFNNSALPFDEDTNVISKLIKEHFDNPPLEFEELKEGMFVWDNKHHTYILIDRIEETYKKTIYFYAIGWECCENMEFEPNRFYRKEVQE